MVYRRSELLCRADIGGQNEVGNKGEKWYIIRDKSSKRTTEVVRRSESLGDSVMSS